MTNKILKELSDTVFHVFLLGCAAVAFVITRSIESIIKLKGKE